MELLTIFGVLRRRPLAVVLGLLLAGAVAIQVAYQISLSPFQLTSRQTTHALGWSRVLVDTPASQLIDAAPLGGDTLHWRAGLLTGLMATEPMTAAIAAKANVPARRLVVHDPSLLTPSVPTPLPERAATASTPMGDISVVKVRVDDLVPIITIQAIAPDRRRAAALVDATGDMLELAAAARPDVPRPAIVLERVSSVRTIDVTEGRGKLFAAAAGIVLFGIWCAAIVLTSGLLRIWRATRRGLRPLSRSLFVRALRRHA